MACKPPRLLWPWDSSGKSTGAGCNFLLQGSSQPRNHTWVSCIAGRFFTYWAMRESIIYIKEPEIVGISVTQSCLTLCDPMDYSLPGSSVHGILQIIILEWVAISSSRESSQLRDWTQVSLHCGQILYHLSHQGDPSWLLIDLCLEARLRNMGWLQGLWHGSLIIGWLVTKKGEWK